MGVMLRVLRASRRVAIQGDMFMDVGPLEVLGELL